MLIQIHQLLFLVKVIKMQSTCLLHRLNNLKKKNYSIFIFLQKIRIQVSKCCYITKLQFQYWLSVNCSIGYSKLQVSILYSLMLFFSSQMSFKILVSPFDTFALKFITIYICLDTCIYTSSINKIFLSTFCIFPF